jgi:cephalosporin hydroxylase|tara:strand:- start:284 stop:1021 length:738 start_codon:yes stop_codon:yes gene_type:complete
MNEIESFEREKLENIKNMGSNQSLREFGLTFLKETQRDKYSHNFTWLGRPIIQMPQDIIAMQEIIWKVKPDLIIETGIAHGGSLVFYASMMELMGGDGNVLGIDIDIRKHNRVEIEKHPMFKRITIFQGSSVDEDIVKKVNGIAKGKKTVLVALDSNHTHDHVLQEMRLYSSLVTKGSYLVVFDTTIEDVPDDLFKDRPWGRGNNPRTAIKKFLQENNRFVVDKEIADKLVISVVLDGYLKCVKD